MTSQVNRHNLASSREVIGGEGQGEGAEFAVKYPLILTFSPKFNSNKFFQFSIPLFVEIGGEGTEKAQPQILKQGLILQVKRFCDRLIGDLSIKHVDRVANWLAFSG